ncbi:DUF4238 domain-containing protein [Acidovorax sp.]|jgi:hypothetical protein|uniref:DUF4238 domain-containing protein n=1 Tax=Acidovorax sp. TaxID=1872122 RepID=UPI00391F3FC6
MGSEARHHHYVPQGYLRGFGHKKGKNWFVFANDLGTGRSYEANTRNVCGERDFMRFESKGHAPDVLEKELSKLEGAACQAIRSVVQTAKFESEDKVLIVNLMALLAVRSPERRESMRQSHETVAKRLLDLIFADKERWDTETDKLGDANSSKVSYEQAKEFHERAEYTIEVNRERHILNEFGVFDTVLQLLGQRQWTLYTTSGEYGEFVTTNRPVVIAYKEPEKVPPFMRHSPGFGLTETEVYFPLTKHAFLIGRWDRGGQTEVATQSFIAAANTHMMAYSYGQVYSAEREILHCDESTNMHWDAEFLRRFNPTVA